MQKEKLKAAIQKSKLPVARLSDCPILDFDL